MVDREQVINLLANGVPTSHIASAVGCDDSYISQLRQDPEVQSKVAEKRTASLAADLSFDETLDSAERLALEKINQTLRFANLGQALKAFQILNHANKRNDQRPQNPSSGSTVSVVLQLPASISPQYLMDPQARIVEVEGRTMLTASPQSLDQVLAARASAKGTIPSITAVERAANRLGALTMPVPAKAVKNVLGSKLTVDML